MSGLPYILMSSVVGFLAGAIIGAWFGVPGIAIGSIFILKDALKARNVEESRDDQLWTCPIIVRSCCPVVTDSQRTFLYQIFARTDAQGYCKT